MTITACNPATPRRRPAGFAAALAVTIAAVASAAPAAAASRRPALGQLDSAAVRAGLVTIAGWAADPAHPGAPVTVIVTRDGRPVGTSTATLPRPDVARALHLGPRTGFRVTVPTPAGRHTFCAVVATAPAPVACLSLTAPASPLPVSSAANGRIAAAALRLVGYRFTDGGASPRTGFDCSGLTSYVYQSAAGIRLPRNAAAQARAARPISAGSAQPGDLVFFLDPSGWVYHVGVYLSPGMMVAAATFGEGVKHQTIWSAAVRYGTVTHS